MKYKITIIIFALAALIISLFLDRPGLFGVCYMHVTPGGSHCAAPYAQIAAWLLPLSAALLASSLFAFFTSRTVFKRWLKFTIGYAIVAAILMLTMPNIRFGLGGMGLSIYDYKGLAELLSLIYLGLSLGLLLISRALEMRRK